MIFIFTLNQFETHTHTHTNIHIYIYIFLHSTLLQLLKVFYHDNNTYNNININL